MFAGGGSSEVDDKARPCALARAVGYESGDLSVQHGKWSCNGLDVRRSMHRESMRYQLDPEERLHNLYMCRNRVPC